MTHDGIVLDEPTIYLPRVTTIIGQTLAKPELTEWYYRTTIEGVEILHDNFPEAFEQFALEELLEANRLRPHDLRDERADEGTETHEYLATLARWTSEIIWPAAGDGYQEAVLDWWESQRKDVVASEAILLSLKHGFAGSCDLVCDLGNTPRVIVDLKTRRAGGQAYVSDHLQLAAYRIAWNEMHPDQPCNPTSVVLLAFDDGTWRMVESKVPERTFLSLLDVWYTTLRKGAR
jgi:hypothetical protein